MARNKDMNMASEQTRVIELVARINDDNELILTFDDAAGDVELRPNRGLEDLLGVDPSARSITVQVRDFLQFGSIYDVYGATLAETGQVIATHWESIDNGRRCTFTLSARMATRKAEARTVRFTVGATPRRPGAPVPVPFMSRQTPGGSFPTDGGGGKKGS